MHKWWVLGAMLALVGCAGGGKTSYANTVTELCETTCAKVEECGLAGGMSAEECQEFCEESSTVNTNDEDCTVTAAERNACLDAFEDVSCDDMSSGITPEECQLCESSVDTDPVSTVDTDASTGGGSCADLAQCCAQIADETQKSGCEALVALGNALQCSGGLLGYETSGMCSVP